jgi:hypothetical protein
MSPVPLIPEEPQDAPPDVPDIDSRINLTKWFYS